MKNYTVKQGDTFSSLSQQFNIKYDGLLKTYHNLHCPIEDVMQEPIPGKQIIIPEDPEFFETKEPTSAPTSDDEMTNSTNEYKGSEEENQQESPSSAKPQKEKKKDNNSDDHESIYFVIQKATLQCNQGFTFPTLKVTSHQKHYANHSGNDPDYLAATEDDLQLNPTSQPFGQCKLKPSSSGYLPCAYAPAGKWQKAYDKTKVMDKACLTERSELMCSTGGKITILNHGQQSEITKSHVNNANTLEQQAYNPVVDFDALKEEADDNEAEAW